VIRTPYGFLESAGWLKRFILGPGRKHAIKQPFPPFEMQFEKVEDPRWYGFMGDIMSLGERKIVWDPSVLEFLSGCSGVFVNLEGVFHRSKIPAWTTQFQSASRTLEALEKLRDKHRTRVLVTLANNHAADFGEAPLKRTWRKLEEAGLFPLGFRGSDVILLDERLRVVVATQWSNRPNNHVVELDEVEVLGGVAGPVEVLYPHWGHEFELYPRPELISRALSLHKRFPVIIGHHSHTPQPIIPEMGGRHRVQITAYSLGNVAAYFKNDLVNRGIFLKLEIGRGKGGGWVIGGMKWTWIHGDCSVRRRVIVRRTESCPFFTWKQLR
jgi:hypothetical protein